MSEIYTVIVGILGILAVSGLFVGVTNDAVNFLNSAIGSKAASMKIILTVASVGIIIGVVTSSGMMEVARSGMFNPGLFTFHEVMMLYLGVMFANVILLDLYNSWGLPTSTTVSLIFCLLGAAIAVSIYKISNDPEQGVSSLGHYINTSRAMGIVSAILLSVVIAFTCGTLVMYVSRMIFSFRYTALFRRYGSLWCGASLTAIVYFAVFKGLKSILADHAFIQLIDNHLPSAIAICWVVCSLLLFFIQRFKVNILRITILSGTFALALAFAGNDLVNFIGVPVAGFDAYTIAREAGDTQMLMGALNENVPANFLILLTAGILMILTLWTSKKAMHVSETELSLSAQFAWVADRWMINNDRYFDESNGRFVSFNQSKRLLNRWKKPGDITDIPRHGVYTEFDDRLLEDASFLRLKNLMLSYTFPQEWLRKTRFIGGARIYAQAQNLFTFTKFTGLDPEGNSNMYQAQYPMARQFTFGLDLTF
jgi:phosphate/sulfate permease